MFFAFLSFIPDCRFSDAARIRVPVTGSTCAPDRYGCGKLATARQPPSPPAALRVAFTHREHLPIAQT